MDDLHPQNIPPFIAVDIVQKRHGVPRYMISDGEEVKEKVKMTAYAFTLQIRSFSQRKSFEKDPE